MMIRLALLTILLLSDLSSFAQHRDTIIDGRTYIIHEVQARETLYGISRLYGAELNDVVVANPIVIQGLQIGYSILIPTNKKTISTNSDDIKISPVEIIKPEPQFSTLHSVKKDTGSHFEPFRDTNKVNVALLLPFYLDLNDSLKTKSNQTIVYPKSSIALDFYFGFQLVLDTLKSLNYNIDLMLLDVPNDSVFDVILNENILYDREYIFGPIFIRQFEELAKYYGYDSNKKLISPLSYKSVKGNYQNVYQSVPIPEVQLDTIINRLIMKYRNEPIIILGNNKEEELFDYSKNKLQTFINQNRCEAYSIDEKQLEDRQSLKLKLRSDRNVILVTSNNRSFVSRLLPMLGSMEDTSFTVFGLDNWNRFDNLDYDDLEQLNVHLPKSFGMNTNKLFDDFVNNYIDKYHTYPTKYAFMAYLQGLYFLSNEFSQILNFDAFYLNGIKSNYTFDITEFFEYQQITID
ncbi:MAG: LysM peptidoglycan-binding domain-containing protein [Flavobacteriales bacterium]